MGAGKIPRRIPDLLQEVEYEADSKLLRNDGLGIMFLAGPLGDSLPCANRNDFTPTTLPDSRPLGSTRKSHPEAFSGASFGARRRGFV